MSHHTTYDEAARVARERATRCNIDVCIRPASQYDQPGYIVAYAAHMDSDYHLYEIVTPPRCVERRGEENQVMNPEIKTIDNFERYGVAGWQWTTISINGCIRHYRTNMYGKGVWLDGIRLKLENQFELIATNAEDALKQLLEKLK